jgi:ABC-type antimicrobial peptide transport system permease subunit
LDDVALIPFSTAQQRLFGFAKLTSILIQSTGPESIPTVVAGVRKALEASHRIAPGHPDDFTVTTNQALLDLTQQQSWFFPRMLTGVALIALLLGGIGVLNVMLMAVADRGPEIGLRLAVGAQPEHIQLQFLVEALTLTVVGGLGGTLGGLLASTAIPRVVSQLADYPSMPTATAIAFALGVSVLVGLAFGYYPARTASRLNPIEVLGSSQ